MFEQYIKKQTFQNDLCRMKQDERSPLNFSKKPAGQKAF